MKIGVIGIQGAVSEHIRIVELLGHDAVWINGPGGLEGVSGIIIPGGESTTIGRLMIKACLFDAVRKRALAGMPVYGTCAGMVMLSKKGGGQVKRTGQKLLGLMDIEVERNAFGGQRESFEKVLDVGRIKGFQCVFIRAPAVKRVWGSANVLARVNGKIVAVEQGNLLATSFHPELTDDTRIHEYFISKCEGLNSLKPK
ncbi:MAG: pyridoxal 5'-phosphate synthase glutaminase subunit PdxT [Candidatus Micrarchaeota archaeon]